MSNDLYAYGRQLWLAGQMNWLTDPIKVVLVDTSAYTPNLNTDQFLNAVPPAARIAVSGTLTGRTGAQGIADADDVTFGSVLGSTVTALVMFRDSGVAATSPLLYFAGTAVGLPVTPDGGNIKVTWDNGNNKVFVL